MNVSHEPLFELDTLIRLNYVFTGCCESWIIRDLFSFLLISLHAIHYACVIHCGFFSKVFFIIIADKCWSQPVESSPPGIYNSRYKELVNNLFSSRHENFTWNHFRNESNKRCRFHVESRWNGPREIGRELIGPSSLEHASKKRARSHEASNKIQMLFAVSTIGSTAGRRLEMEETRRRGLEASGPVHRIVIVPFAILMIRNEGERNEESRLPSMHLPFRALARKQWIIYPGRNGPFDPPAPSRFLSNPRLGRTIPRWLAKHTEARTSPPSPRNCRD